MKMTLLLTTIIVCTLLIFTGIVSAPEEITFLCGAWMDGFAKSFKEINGYDYVAPFEEETGIKVNFTSYPYEQMIQTIEVLMKAKSSQFDVLEVDAPLTASYAIRGYIDPIDDLLPPEEQGRFFPSTVNLAKWNEKVYSMPFENSDQVMYYNKDLFEKAGIPFPPMDVNQRWTWEKVVETAQKIQKTLNKEGETKIWGLLFDQVYRCYQLLILPQSLGAGSGVGPDGIQVKGFLDNEGWIEAMTWWYNVNNTWKIHPKGITPSESPQMFASGDVAMFIGRSWHIGASYEKLREEGRLNYGIAPHPYFEGGEPATPTNSWHLGLNPYSEHKEAAKKFIKYLSSDKLMADWFRGTKRLTANRSMFEVIDNFPEYNYFPLNAFKEIVKYELDNTAAPRPITPLYLEWNDSLDKAFSDVQNGADPRTVLDNTVSILERMAKKYQ